MNHLGGVVRGGVKTVILKRTPIQAPKSTAGKGTLSLTTTVVRGMSETEIDTDEMKQRMKDRYRENTGKELPDHVVENYDEFFNLGPSMADIESIQRHEQERREELYNKWDVARALGTSICIVGVIAFFLGGGWFLWSQSLLSEFGIGIMALVFAGVGFVLGTILAS